jgi:hypothetical protein
MKGGEYWKKYPRKWQVKCLVTYKTDVCFCMNCLCLDDPLFSHKTLFEQDWQPVQQASICDAEDQGGVVKKYFQGFDLDKSSC